MIKKNCKICGKEFSKNPHMSYKNFEKQIYCSRECVTKGVIIWNKGKKLPYNPHPKMRGKIPWNKQIKQKKNCLHCKKEFKVTQWEMKYKKFCSKQCSDIHHGLLQKGKNSHFWKGGLTPKNKIIRNSADFCNWRKKVFERDNYTCQECGIYSGCGKRVYLEAHHIKSFAQHPELRFEVNNGLTLCENCHHKTISWSFKQGIIQVKIERIR